MIKSVINCPKLSSRQVGELKLLQCIWDSVPYYLGIFGRYPVVVAQSHQGSGGSQGSQSQDTIRTAIEHFKPKAVIQIGIGFGVDRTKQRVGDVMVSQWIQPYEKTKVVNGDQKNRNKPIPCDDHWESLFTFCCVHWKRRRALTNVKLAFGPFLSG